MTASWCWENLRDCKGWAESNLPVTTTSDRSAQLYDAALRQMIARIDCEELGGVEGTIKSAMRHDQTFVLGRALLYGWQLLGSHLLKTSFKNDVCSLIQDAKATDLHQRELLHVRAVELLNNGHLDKAVQVWESIMDTNPADLHALKCLNHSYLYLGKSSGLRDIVKKIQPFWNETMPLYSLLVGLLAFGFEENGQYADAELTAYKALELKKNDINAIHALAHVFTMKGQYSEALEMLAKTEIDWKPFNHLSRHIYWHWALLHLTQFDYQAALTVFDEHLAQAMNCTAVFPIYDAATMLYRMELAGVDVGSRWDTVLEAGLPFIGQHAHVLNDVILTMTFLGAQNYEALETHGTSINRYVRSTTGINCVRTKCYGLPVCEALVAYHMGDYARAEIELRSVEDNFVLLGGSNAYRDLFKQLLQTAHKKAHLQSTNDQKRKFTGVYKRSAES